MSSSQVEQIRALLKSIETGDPEPIAVVNEAKYIQHNPQTHEGSEGLAALFARLSKTQPRVNMVRGFEDGAFVFAHMEYDFASRKIGFEMFRFEDGQAVEHWDNIQERQGPNRAGHSMVDGPTEAEDLDQTEANRAGVRAFVETVLITGKLDRLGEFIDAGQYTEHNPRLDDNLNTLHAALAERDEQGARSIQYERLHRVLAQGNFVLTASEGRRGDVHSAFYDLFRLRDGKIVEHWDTTEKIAPKDQWKNDNGKF
ncbi:MAG: nuclear transport factor 2 family protein [Pseudomonadota bacterium]